MNQAAVLGTIIVSCLELIACGSSSGDAHPEDPRVESDTAAHAHLRFFGYVAIDCAWDDPHDNSSKSSYLDEVQDFTNTAHMCVFSPTDNLLARLDAMRAAKVKPMLDVSAVLWEDTNPDPAVTNYGLVPDYASRWSTFVEANELVKRAAELGSIYPVDEPMLNGVSFAELQTAVRLVDATLPTVPILIVEAYSELAALEVPSEVDWLGFDRYGVPDASQDAEYLADLATLKSKRTRAEQRIVLIPEGQHWPEYSEWGFVPEAMGGVAAGYYAVADSDPDVVGLISYLWPGGLDGPTHYGTRNLPPAAIAIHRQIGALITGK